MNIYRLVLVLFLVALLVNSCSIQKRRYGKGFYIPKKSGVAKKSSSDNVKMEPMSFLTTPVLIAGKENDVENETVPVEAEVVEVDSEDVVITNTECDVIIFRDLSEVSCIVEEVGTEFIKYRKCGFEDGPIYSESKSKISSIMYRNGSADHFKVEEKKEESITEHKNWEVDNREDEILGMTSFALGVLGIPLLSIIFGLISLHRIKNNPEKYKSSMFAYVGIGLGVVLIAFIVIVLLVL